MSKHAFFLAIALSVLTPCMVSAEGIDFQARSTTVLHDDFDFDGHLDMYIYDRQDTGILRMGSITVLKKFRHENGIAFMSSDRSYLPVDVKIDLGLEILKNWKNSTSYAQQTGAIVNSALSNETLRAVFVNQYGLVAFDTFQQHLAAAGEHGQAGSSDLDGLVADITGAEPPPGFVAEMFGWLAGEAASYAIGKSIEHLSDEELKGRYGFNTTQLSNFKNSLGDFGDLGLDLEDRVPVDYDPSDSNQTAPTGSALDNAQQAAKNHSAYGSAKELQKQRVSMLDDAITADLAQLAKNDELTSQSAKQVTERTLSRYGYVAAEDRTPADVAFNINNRGGSPTPIGTGPKGTATPDSDLNPGPAVADGTGATQEVDLNPNPETPDDGGGQHEDNADFTDGDGWE